MKKTPLRPRTKSNNLKSTVELGYHVMKGIFCVVVNKCCYIM